MVKVTQSYTANDGVKHVDYLRRGGGWTPRRSEGADVSHEMGAQLVWYSRIQDFLCDRHGVDYDLDECLDHAYSVPPVKQDEIDKLNQELHDIRFLHDADTNLISVLKKRLADSQTAEEVRFKKVGTLQSVIGDYERAIVSICKALGIEGTQDLDIVLTAIKQKVKDSEEYATYKYSVKNAADMLNAAVSQRVTFGKL
jgi:hypothetical protein